jgi:putative sigma-54 modulation protein
MNINIRGENLEVTGALREYVEKKLSRLERYFDIPPASDVHVTLRVEKDKQNVEVTIPLRGAVLRAEEKNHDMYASIDLVVDKLERQIRKHKTKVNRKFYKEGGLRNLFAENGAAVTTAYMDEDEDELEVVRTKKFTMKPMDVEEAILQMNLIGHTFFVFANMDNNQINVVYKRDDGRYGLIETV